MKNSTRQCHLARTAQVLSHIEAALDEDLSLEQLARWAYMAPFHFHKVFRQIVGVPVRGYIRELRLSRAAHLLATSDRRILDIALAAHYQSNEAFTRAFKKRFGISPSHFRDQAASLASTADEHPDQAGRRAGVGGGGAEAVGIGITPSAPRAGGANEVFL